MHTILNMSLTASVVVFIAVAMAACTAGNMQAYSTEAITSTTQHYAMEQIAAVINELEAIPNVNIIGTRINSFEKVAIISHILPNTLELWRLDFDLQVEENPLIRWGTFTPDQDNWFTRYTDFNETMPLLLFSSVNDEVEFIGTIPSWMDRNLAETSWELESILRDYLDYSGIHPFPQPIPYVGAAHQTLNIVMSIPLPDSNLTFDSIEIFETTGHAIRIKYVLAEGATQYNINHNFLLNNANLLFSNIKNLVEVEFITPTHQGENSIRIHIQP